jgi:hypothetical protein
MQFSASIRTPGQRIIAEALSYAASRLQGKSKSR